MQREVADAIGVALQTYQRYEYGTSKPTLSK
ncbi:MAG: helix-turn-helix transcriptional regulator [Oscillospiraceae bacterium]|nr:helix-turn-helix transcriptional regulator [Oscillospiraceae bacterium]